eukprot:11180982-Lingulodinium_polyedra.AAC.1
MKTRFGASPAVNNAPGARRPRYTGPHGAGPNTPRWPNWTIGLPGPTGGAAARLASLSSPKRCA